MCPEVVQELAGTLPTDWRWRPQVHQDGEAQTLLERSVESGLPKGARDQILDSAVNLLARCPSPFEGDPLRVTGLAVGYVQSGKTLSFTTVAALAADNQYPIVIVLSGTKRNLYAQTVKRLRLDLGLEDPSGRWSLFEAQTNNPDLPQHLRDLLKLWDEEVRPGYPRRTALITVLKNRRRVDALAKALAQVDLSGRSCLVIDDEADQHGLNTKVNQGEESRVYQALLRLRAVLPRHAYLQYTATPQAVLLISVMDTLSPDFGWIVEPGDGYTGGASFFSGGTEGLIRIISEPDLHQLLDEHEDSPPESLLEALRLFFVGVACQAILRGREGSTQRHRSMLVHPSMYRIDHHRFKAWIDAVRDSWSSVLSGESEDRTEVLQAFERSWQSLAATAPLGSEVMPGFDDVVPYLPPAIRETRTWEVNSQVLEQWSQDNWNQAASHILVGGENLGRGFTIEGLTVTYMPRGRGTGIADTIQQRARFFGYKAPYLGLCRVFLARQVRIDYCDYIEHETYVMDQLRDLANAGEPMTEWRRRMLLAASLRPTRRSVVPDIYRHLHAAAWTGQSQPWVNTEDQFVENNWAILNRLLGELAFTEDEGHPARTQEQRNAASEPVPLLRVLGEVLVPYNFSQFDAPGFSVTELCIQWHLREHPNATARIYKMSEARRRLNPGGGKRRRQIGEDGRLGNLYQGAAPVEPISRRGSVYPGDQRIVDPNRVTVQVHDLNLTDPDLSLLRGHVPAITVWLPESLRKDVFWEDPPS